MEDIRDAINSLEITLIRHGNTGLIEDIFSIKTIKQAVKALNKQIPVKGLIKKYETTNGGVLGERRVCVCPMCKKAIVPVGYCGECGQKLDWD